MAGELMMWKDRAREIRTQILNRFRVAVDRHRQWKVESDYSLMFRRWIRKYTDSDQSIPRASYRFYRKRVGKVVDGVDESAIVRMVQAVAVPVIGSACHVFMHGLNHVKVYGVEKLHQALLHRPEGKALLTVSNHVAAIDDPFVVASLLPPNIMLDARNLKWTLCASDRCFSNTVFSALFRCLKVLPVSRGDGVYQQGMDMALSKINGGGWVHIFPEGMRSRNGGRTIGPAKRGVGRLVMDADNLPIVIPFVHIGMHEIMPVGTKLPKVGKQVTVVVGDPIYLDDLAASREDTEDNSRGILYDTVSSRIGSRLQELKLLAEKLDLEHRHELEQCRLSKNNKNEGYGIWEQVDWEAFGMQNIMPSLSEKIEPHFVKNTIVVKPKEEEETPKSGSMSSKLRFGYDGGIVSRVRHYVNPSEFMGFAARGLFADCEISDDILRIHPVKAWKRFLNERELNEGPFSIRDTRPVRAWKQLVNEKRELFDGTFYRVYSNMRF